MSKIDLFALVVDFLAVVGVTTIFANAGKLLGPKPEHRGDAELPYETGMPPLAPAHERMTVLYHRFAVLFVVFDVDLAFLLPWALTRGQLTAVAMTAMTVFILLMLMMLGYFWRKGTLECR